MNSFFKGVAHMVISVLVLWVPTFFTSHPDLNLSISAAIGILLNWGLSHTIPTTSGASAVQ